MKELLGAIFIRALVFIMLILDLVLVYILFSLWRDGFV